MCSWDAYERNRLPVLGMDEVGRGAMAGPLVAAAVAFAPATLELPEVKAIVDSKMLPATERDRLSAWIVSHAAVVQVESIGVSAINTLGIGWANRSIYGRLMRCLGPGRYLIDGNLRLGQLGTAGNVVVCKCGGDRSSRAIAAASIVAKVWRDRLMIERDQAYPFYGWARNVGYATLEHRRAIQSVGPCQEHRTLYLRRLLMEGKDR